jgi:hypothetical protein
MKCQQHHPHLTPCPTHLLIHHPPNTFKRAKKSSGSLFLLELKDLALLVGLLRLLIGVMLGVKTFHFVMLVVCDMLSSRSVVHLVITCLEKRIKPVDLVLNVVEVGFKYFIILLLLFCKNRMAPAVEGNSFILIQKSIKWAEEEVLIFLKS